MGQADRRHEHVPVRRAECPGAVERERPGPRPANDTASRSARMSGSAEVGPRTPVVRSTPRLQHSALDPVPVPVLLFTGPTGVGKSAVLSAASSLLSDAGVSHAAVTLSDIGRLYPAPVEDKWNELIAHRNLRSLWTNYAAEGAERLLLERVLEPRSLLRRVVAAVPGADITVVRLRAPLPLLRERIVARQAGDPAWYLEAAEYLDSVFDTAGIED